MNFTRKRIHPDWERPAFSLDIDIDIFRPVPTRTMCALLSGLFILSTRSTGISIG